MTDSEAIAFAIAYVESFLREGRPDIVDRMLVETDVRLMPASAILAVLRLTAHAITDLPGYPDFHRRCLEALAEKIGTERAAVLIRATEKALQRYQDARNVAEGRTTREELARKNGIFALPGACILWDEIKDRKQP